MSNGSENFELGISVVIEEEPAPFDWLCDFYD